MSAALQAVKQFRIREFAPLLKADPKLSTSTARPKVLNPFLPHKNPESGRWAPPKYSLRRQAELIKSARASGLLHLLPPGPKLAPKTIEDASTSAPAAATTEATEQAKWWTATIEWDGEFKEKEVKGADVGNRLYAGKKRMFKGHKWERMADKRTWKRDMLMKHMSKRIARFKTVRGLESASRLRVVLTGDCVYRRTSARRRAPSALLGRYRTPSFHFNVHPHASCILYLLLYFPHRSQWGCVKFRASCVVVKVSGILFGSDMPRGLLRGLSSPLSNAKVGTVSLGC